MSITRGGGGLGMRLASVMTCDDSSADGAGTSAWSVMVAWSVMILRPASKMASVRESGGILRSPAALHIPDHDDAAGGIGAARHERGGHGPSLCRARLARLPKFKLCILPLGEQAHRTAFPQKRKALIEQGLEGSDGARGDDVRRPFEARHEILDARGMHACRRLGDALSLAQECGLFIIAFNEMDMSTGAARQRAGDHQAGKSAARAEVDPNAGFGGEVEKLEGIGNVPHPQVRDRGWCDEVGGPLPGEQKRDEAIEALQGFT